VLVAIAAHLHPVLAPCKTTDCTRAGRRKGVGSSERRAGSGACMPRRRARLTACATLRGLIHAPSPSRVPLCSLPARWQPALPIERGCGAATQTSNQLSRHAHVAIAGSGVASGRCCLQVFGRPRCRAPSPHKRYAALPRAIVIKAVAQHHWGAVLRGGTRRNDVIACLPTMCALTWPQYLTISMPAHRWLGTDCSQTLTH
jgi:hypothetical protein